MKCHEERMGLWSRASRELEQPVIPKVDNTEQYAHRREALPNPQSCACGRGVEEEMGI